MSIEPPYRIKTITEFHRFRGLSEPDHPLISLIDFATIRHLPEDQSTSWVNDFYSIGLKRSHNSKLLYGQQRYDYDNGIMFFMAPGQLLRIQSDKGPTIHHSGWLLLVHPDFLWSAPLAKTIQQYEFFDYAVNEALFLSPKEEVIITDLLQHIGQEYRTAIDKFSQHIILAQLELLLSYAERFYHRQFITRKATNHRILDRLEEILKKYFDDDELLKDGPPTVQYIAQALHVSPNYLSGLLKVLTGQSTQQHIQDKLIEKAKERLSTTDLTVSEIAFALGFEYPQSFSKLFKTRTSFSPLEFRASYHK